MNASIITATTTPVAATSSRKPEGVQATRRSGAVAGLGVAILATLIATLLGAPYLALGIPAAAVAGYLLGPQIRSNDGIVGPGITMGGFTVVLADAMLMVGSVAKSVTTADPFGGPRLVDTVAGSFVLFTLGLVIVGIPMLLVTIPCGVIWSAIVRRVAASGPANRTAIGSGS